MPVLHVHAQQARAGGYLAAGDAASAAKLLVSVAALYRRERWHGPLAASLLEAREAASRLGDVRVCPEAPPRKVAASI